jgi:hypothetical protein
MDQETYLKEVSMKEIFRRGVKKVLGEVTSVKFILLVFVCLGIAMKWVTDVVGLGAALVLVGLREVPVEAILNRLTDKLTE